MRHLQPDHDQPITPPPPFPIILLHPVLYGCVCVSWVPINPPPPFPIILLHPVLYGCVCVSWVWSHKSDRRLARRSARWSDSGECTSRGRPSPATACGSGRGMLRRAEGPNLRKQNGLRAAGAAGGGTATRWDHRARSSWSVMDSCVSHGHVGHVCVGLSTRRRHPSSRPPSAPTRPLHGSRSQRPHRSPRPSSARPEHPMGRTIRAPLEQRHSASELSTSEELPA